MTETVVSIIRRLLDRNAHPGEPDSAHLHHVVHRSWAKSTAIRFRLSSSQNAITSVFMWFLPLLTLIFVAYSGLGSLNAMLFLSGSITIYLLSYRGITARETSLREG